ncbi:MAG: potassium transporter TrkG, partial [Clostridia bacterium]
MNEQLTKHKLKHTLHRLSGVQILAFGYLLVILVGSFLLSLPIASKARIWTPYINALFASTSATCVTGLVAYDTFTHWSGFGQAILLMLIQIGGIGFMTFISLIAMFLKRKIGLYERKILMQSAGSLKLSGIVALIKRILIGTLVFETFGTCMLMIVFVPRLGFGMGLWNSIFHSVSAFCNAGFDLMGRYQPFSSFSTMYDNIIINFTLMFLIVMGGLGFIVWSDIWDCKANFKKFQLHTKIVLVSTAILIILPTI